MMDGKWLLWVLVPRDTNKTIFQFLFDEGKQSLPMLQKKATAFYKRQMKRLEHWAIAW